MLYVTIITTTLKHKGWENVRFGEIDALPPLTKF